MTLARIALLSLFALLLPRLGAAQDDAPPAVPFCEGATLFVPGPDGAVEIALPASCLQAATDGDRTAVAAGEAGAFLVEHADPAHPTIVLVPSVGAITGVDFTDGALAVAEALELRRTVVIGDDGQVLVPTVTPPEPEIEPEPVDAVLPIPDTPTERTLLGVVDRIQGRRALVTREPGAPTPPIGSAVVVRKAAVETTVEGGRVRPGREALIRVVTVDGATDDHLVLLLGRGDVVRPGAQVLWGGNTGRPTARLVGPKPWRNQLAVIFEVAPGFSASVWSPGSHLQGRLRVSYAAPVPLRFELGVEHFALGQVPDGQPFVGADVQVLAELDLEPFGIGITGGYQSLGIDHSGGTVGGLIRGGFRDGLHLEARVRFVPGANNPFGGVEARGVIPFNPQVGLALEGGGGSGLGFGRLGVTIHPLGQGGPGTVIFNPMVGVSVMSWTGLSDRDDPWSGARVNHVGPAVTLRIEVRP